MKTDKSIIVSSIVILAILIFIVNLDRIIPAPSVNTTIIGTEQTSSPATSAEIDKNCVAKYNIKEDVVFFYSDTCPHCLAMKPIVQELEDAGSRVYKINYANEFITECLRSSMSGYVPEFVCLNNGKHLLGETSKDNLKAFFDECALAKA